MNYGIISTKYKIKLGYKMNKLIFITIFTIIFIINACSNKTAITKKNYNKIKQTNYNIIINKISNNKLDKADDLYIKLKSSNNQNKIIKKAATSLAIAHMSKKEYILANFYIQEALEIEPYDSYLKYMLVKNQFLSAIKNNRDKSYIKKALKALEINKALLTNSDYLLLANTMLIRVKLDIALSNKEISDMYKKLNKDEAYNIYKSKVEEMGFNLNNIIKY